MSKRASCRILRALVNVSQLAQQTAGLAHTPDKTFEMAFIPKYGGGGLFLVRSSNGYHII
jgi:hypothetical protein